MLPRAVRVGTTSKRPGSVFKEVYCMKEKTQTDRRMNTLRYYFIQLIDAYFRDTTAGCGNVVDKGWSWVVLSFGCLVVVPDRIRISSGIFYRSQPHILCSFFPIKYLSQLTSTLSESNNYESFIKTQNLNDKRNGE